MKILISYLFVAILSVWNAQAACPTEPDNKGIKIRITVELGKPTLCLGWGICDIEIGSTLSANEGFVEVGDGSGGGGGSSWFLYLSKESLLATNPEHLGRFEGQRTINFENTYVLPEEVKKALGVSKDLVIQGNSTYPVRLENGYYVVRIPL